MEKDEKADRMADELRELRRRVADLEQYEAERSRAEETLRESEEKYRLLFYNSPIGIFNYDVRLRITDCNDSFVAILQSNREELIGLDMNKLRDQGVLPAIRRAVEGEPGLYQGPYRARRSSPQIWISMRTAPIFDPARNVKGGVGIVEDLTERRLAEDALTDLTRQASLGAEIGAVLVQDRKLGRLLQLCAESVVRHLDAAFARIWTLNEKDNVLELQASAGMYTHLDGPHGRVPVGTFKIGLIAQEKKPHLTNEVIGDPRVSDQEWARREGMVAFAGHPLVVADKLVGVLAMFAKKPLTEASQSALAAIADEIALGIERKRAEEALHEQKMFAENLIENSAVATFVLDSRHRVVIWSKACEELTGIPASRMLGTDDQWRPFYDNKRQVLADIVLGTEFSGLSDLYPAYAKSTLVPEALRAEGWFKNLNGKDRYMLFDAAPVYDSKGALIAAIETLQDITDRKLAEEETKRDYHTQAVINSLLQLSLEDVPLGDILRRALDLVLTVPWLVVQGRGAVFLIEDDPSLLVMKAQRRIEVRIQKTCEIVPFGKCICGQAALTKDIEFAPHLDERHEITYDGIVPHGHYCVPIVYAGTTIGLINVYLNEGHQRDRKEEAFLSAVANTLAGIIVRRRTEESLAESEHKLRAITDTATDAIILIDEEEKVVYWNSSATAMLEYTPDEIMGKALSAIIPYRYRETHAAAFRKFVETGRGAMLGKTYEAYALKRDGAELPVELSISGIRIKGRWYSAGILRDITERKKLEDQLRQAQKMEAIGQLAGGIAHDFNNILSAIIGYGHLMHMKMKEGDPLRESVERILESADRAAHLTHSLLAFSRKQIINPHPVGLNEIVLHVEKLLRRIIGEDIELKTSLSGKDITVRADSGQIEQVLMNLATNARDAMPRGGSLLIVTGIEEMDGRFVRTHGFGEPGRYAVVRVADTGMGMDEVTRQRVFEPFFTTKEAGKGTGLGLAIVYGIIKQHAGYIDVDSEPGKGTAFRIYLPAVRATPETAATAEPLTPQIGGTETVLVAEDDEALRTLTRSVLEEFGYRVIEAENGEEAVKKFIQNDDRVRLMILDMIMPKKGGKETYDEIRKIRPDIKTIFMSGYTADKEHIASIIGGGMHLLLKPISPRELLKTVREVLDRR